MQNLNFPNLKRSLWAIPVLAMAILAAPASADVLTITGACKPGNCKVFEFEGVDFTITFTVLAPKANNGNVTITGDSTSFKYSSGDKLDEIVQASIKTDNCKNQVLKPGNSCTVIDSLIYNDGDPDHDKNKPDQGDWSVTLTSMTKEINNQSGAKSVSVLDPCPFPGTCASPVPEPTMTLPLGAIMLGLVFTWRKARGRF